MRGLSLMIWFSFPTHRILFFLFISIFLTIPLCFIFFSVTVFFFKFTKSKRLWSYLILPTDLQGIPTSIKDHLFVTNICRLQIPISILNIILFLSEAQISPKSLTKQLLSPGYGLVTAFHCVFVSANMSKMMSVEQVFLILWLKLFSKFNCCIYRSPYENLYKIFLDALSLILSSLNILLPKLSVF